MKCIIGLNVLRMLENRYIVNYNEYKITIYDVKEVETYEEEIRTETFENVVMTYKNILTHELCVEIIIELINDYKKVEYANHTIETINGKLVLESELIQKRAKPIKVPFIMKKKENGKLECLVKIVEKQNKKIAEMEVEKIRDKRIICDLLTGELGNKEMMKELTKDIGEIHRRMNEDRPLMIKLIKDLEGIYKMMGNQEKLEEKVKYVTEHGDMLMKQVMKDQDNIIELFRGNKKISEEIAEDKKSIVKILEEMIEIKKLGKQHGDLIELIKEFKKAIPIHILEMRKDIGRISERVEKLEELEESETEEDLSFRDENEKQEFKKELSGAFNKIMDEAFVVKN